LIRAFLLILVLSALAPLQGCHADSKTAPTEATPPPAPAKPAAVAPPAGSSRLPVIDDENFTVRSIIDRQQGGIPAGIYIAPSQWQDRSEVVWNYSHSSQPVSISVAVEKPGAADAFYAYPTVDLFWLRPVSNYFHVGQNFGGLLFAEPMAPQTALAGFVQRARGNLPGYHVVGMRSLPDLPQALHLPGNDHPQGLGMKVIYTANGQSVEEEFYGVYYSIDIPYDGPQGRTWQINWGLKALHSFRASAGSLDRRRAVFAAMAKSFRPNPAWVQRAAAINQSLTAQFNQNLRAGYDQIAAAAQLSRQISANNDAMIASIDARLQASRRSSSGGGNNGRNQGDAFDDYIRGVDTTDDPYYGTSQHSYDNAYHWTDGYGGYRDSNDPSYNPGQSETGNWTLMQSVH
jgi:hypothetical protein